MQPKCCLILKCIKSGLAQAYKGKELIYLTDLHKTIFEILKAFLINFKANRNSISYRRKRYAIR